MNFPSLFSNNRINDFFTQNKSESLSNLINLDNADWIPVAEITEDDNEFLVKLELPEVQKEDMKIELKNGILCINGERKYEKKDKKLHRVERFYGSFERSFSLPENVDLRNVKAEYKDGVLAIHLHKIDLKPIKKQYVSID